MLLIKFDYIRVVHCFDDVTLSYNRKSGLAWKFSIVMSYFKSNSSLSMFVKARNYKTEGTSSNNSDLIIKVPKPRPLPIIELFV